MTLTEQFEQAAIDVKQLSSTPSNQDLLQLYALYKQATQGDVQCEKPGGFDFRGIAKYEAWEAMKGKSKEEAMQGYIDLVNSLK